jgi:small conductance mechanosensitive channel
MLEQTISQVSTWLQENGPDLLVKIVIFVAILIVFKMLAGVVRRLVRRAVSSSKLDISELLQDFFVSIASKLTLVIGFLIALSQFGVEIGPLVAGLGVAGFIVGFALQDSLGNLAAGLMILLYRPFDVGDFIDAAGMTGKVEAMSIASTTLLTVDNQLLIIPNSKIWGDVIRNVTAKDTRRVDLVFGIGYDDSIPKAEAILSEIVQNHELVLKDPEPVIKLHNLGDSSVDFVVRPWAKTSDYWDVYWDITREVKERFDSEGISIPYPQSDVHLHQQKAQSA